MFSPDGTLISASAAPHCGVKMRCYRKILHISYKNHVTNEEVHAKIQQAIGPEENLLIIVKRRKLKWYEHVSRSSGLARIVLQSTMKGGRRQGRQRKRSEDNIKEWTGLEFAKSQRAVENREKLRKLVAKSSVVPKRPLRLRDRQDEIAAALSCLGLGVTLVSGTVRTPS